MEKAEKKKEIKTIDMKFLMTDTSDNKIVSHLGLKSMSLQIEQFYSNFKKKDLIKILKAYGVNLSMSNNKAHLGQVLAENLNEYSSMPNSSIFKESDKNVRVARKPTRTGCSNSIHSSCQFKNIRKQEKFKEENEENNRRNEETTRRKITTDTVDALDGNCGICGKPKNPDEDWICCDMCSLWCHRDCVGLEVEVDWLMCSDEDAVFTCPMCV